MLQVYNILIHNSKDHAVFIFIIKIGCIPCVIEYILVTYFIHNSLPVLIPCPYIAHPRFFLPTDNHGFVLSMSLFRFCYIH